MPTRDEHLAQVEAVLRRRFFPLVPQDGPAGWTTAQHDANRLSRALSAYALVGLCDVDDATAASCITDGGDDGGIDAAYFDKANNKLVLVQAKFNRRGTAPHAGGLSCHSEWRQGPTGKAVRPVQCPLSESR